MVIIINCLFLFKIDIILHSNWRYEMQRYFVHETFNTLNELTITGESARHISKVMRMEVGDKIIVV